MACTRVRHAIHAKVKALVRPDGTLVARKIEAYSDQGGYASHGHSICANTVTMFKQLYHDEKVTEGDGYTVYTNHATAGAMRAYGIPQSDFITECLMEDIAHKMGWDPIAFRLRNAMREGYVDPNTGITAYTNGLRECVAKGRAMFGWDEKRAKYANETGSIRRGVGMAVFDYKTGVYPISLEVSNCRMLHRGVCVGLGTDGYTNDMLESLKVAKLLHQHNLHDANAAWAEAPQMLFENNAKLATRAFGRPIGVLQPGAAADVIALDYVPLTPLSADNLGGHAIRIAKLPLGGNAGV